ncbi:MAG: succinyl-diaminopimelate desuccinylase [Gammaproteobacteria bacterium]|nr:succinyl-diaminopimelate desuccinylase [Gammaproteobacteria bacterium]
MTDVLTLTQALMRRASVTPDDAGCQVLLAERLAALGFDVEHLPFGPVNNLWARRGKAAPLFVFAGHTDVVPTGPLEAWRYPPFDPHTHEGVLYGRGAADMKSALAAMVIATQRFLAKASNPAGSIGFLITSDEEGDATDGTLRVVQELERRGETIDFCLVGEPSSSHRLGDVVRVGRRGSLNGVLRIRGVQGHVAYPDLAKNPIHAAMPGLAALTQTRWDDGNDYFPATGFQISNIHAGTGATNVIPGALEVTVNFRFNTLQTPQGLIDQVTAILGAHGLDVEATWTLSGMPFLTEQGALVTAVTAAIEAGAGVTPELSTSGGTSDGRFIAPTGAQVVEVGVINATIHKVDECVRVADLETLCLIYEGVLERIFDRAT